MNAIVEFKKNLNGLIDRGEFALPSSVPVEAFRNAAIVAMQDNPYILSLKPETVFKSLRQLAAAGLVPDGREAALVPFKGSCVAMPMVFGLIKTARNSGGVGDIRAHIVYQNEVVSGKFSYTIGDVEVLQHEPILFEDRGEPVAAYAIAKMKDGSIVREFMSARDIDKVRRAGASQRDKKTKQVSDQPIGIWKDWSEEMWKKTVIRRLCKRLPMSAEDYSRVVKEPDLEDSMKDVTPPETTQERLTRVSTERKAEKKVGATPDRSEDDTEQDVVEEKKPVVQDADVLPEFNEGDVFPGDDAFTEGVKAMQAGKPIEDNPHRQNPDYSNWHGGYTEAKSLSENS